MLGRLQAQWWPITQYPIVVIESVCGGWVNSLQWCHNECNGVSNHQPHDCLLNLLFRHRSKNISKLRVTGLCEGNSSFKSEFPTQRASNAPSICIWSLKLKLKSKLDLHSGNHVTCGVQKPKNVIWPPGGHFEKNVLPINISIVPLKFKVDIQSQSKVRVRKPKSPIWPPGGHFESDVAENQ